MLPGVDLDLFAGGMFEESQTFGITTATVGVVLGRHRDYLAIWPRGLLGRRVQIGGSWVKRLLVPLRFHETPPMKEPKPRRSTIRSGRGRQAFLLGALLLLVAITQGRAGAADDGMRADTAGGGWQGTELAERPVRLPPAELASYDAEAMFEPLPPSESYVGYNSGFVIANHGLESPATSDFPFFLRVNSWLQLRHTLFNAADPSEDLNLFSIERLRLGLGGHAYSPNLKYFFQFDGNSDQASQAIFLDYFVTYDLGCEFFGYDANKLGVKAGKWKVPFSRSREESGRRLQFTERSTSNLFFDLNRSIGVGLFGELDAWSTPIRFETAIFNGFQSGADTDIRDSGLDQNFAWSARVYTDLFSEFGSDGEPDLGWHPEPALRLGFGLAGTRVDAIGANEFSQPRVVDSGARLASLLLPLGTTSYDIGMYTVDAHWKHRGRSVIAEYYWRCLAAFPGRRCSRLVGLWIQSAGGPVRGSVEAGTAGALVADCRGLGNPGRDAAEYRRGRRRRRLVYQGAQRQIRSGRVPRERHAAEQSPPGHAAWFRGLAAADPVSVRVLTLRQATAS